MLNWSQLNCTIFSIVLTLSPCLTSVAQAQSVIDLVPPSVLHESEAEPISGDHPYVLTATVADENGVKRVTLFYRAAEQSKYKSTELRKSGAADTFVIELAASELSPPRFEYYLQAEDVAGNIILRGHSYGPLILTIVEGTGAPQSVDNGVNNKSIALEDSGSSKKWLWIGLGALAVGALAASGGSTGGGNDDDESNVTINIPNP